MKTKKALKTVFFVIVYVFNNKIWRRKSICFRVIFKDRTAISFLYFYSVFGIFPDRGKAFFSLSFPEKACSKSIFFMLFQIERVFLFGAFRFFFSFIAREAETISISSEVIASCRSCWYFRFMTSRLSSMFFSAACMFIRRV